MANPRKLPYDFSFEELEQELIIRGAQNPKIDPFKFSTQEGSSGREKVMEEVRKLYEHAKSLTPNPDLKHLDIQELTELVMSKSINSTSEEVRSHWYADNRMDIYKVKNKHVRKNAESVVSICFSDALIPTGDGTSLLKLKEYGTDFNLAPSEPFRTQPISVGRLCTGFLVKDDVIATAGHCICETTLSQLRFVFGFKMLDSTTAATQVPEHEIYHGIEIIKKGYNRTTDLSDWALVRLDRKVIGHPVVKLAEENILPDQPVYVIGHPLGLPLKYAPGAKVCSIKTAFFSANLDVYSGNSGSPVFSSKTHEVVGIVVRGDGQDFKWTGNSWVSLIYPNRDFSSIEPQCTNILELPRFY